MNPISLTWFGDMYKKLTNNVNNFLNDMIDYSDEQFITLFNCYMYDYGGYNIKIVTKIYASERRVDVYKVMIEKKENEQKVVLFRSLFL